MEPMRLKSTMWATVALLVLSTYTAVALDLGCAMSFKSCVTSTAPTTDCCDALKTALADNLQCFCSLLQNKLNLPIDTTQLMMLPQSCGINGGLDNCSNGTTPNPPGLGTQATPSPPGLATQDGASSIAWMGMSGLVTLFLFFWSIVG